MDKIEVSDDQKKFELDTNMYLGEWVQVLIDKINEIVERLNKDD